MLLYETTDAEFAERALAALREAQIPCYKTETSALSNKYAMPVAGDAHFYLFVEQPRDYRAASDVLIHLGAVVDSPPRLPPFRILLTLLALAIAVAIFVATGWAPK